MSEQYDPAGRIAREVREGILTLRAAAARDPERFAGVYAGLCLWFDELGEERR